MAADHVIIAPGQKPDLSFIEGSMLKLNHRGAIFVDPITQATSESGLFAAGDIADGPRTITDAMAAGRRAATSIDRYLQGTELEVPDISAGVRTGEEILPEAGAVSRAARTRMQTLPLAERARNFKEVDRGFGREEAEHEAARCLRCNTCLRCVDRTGCIALSLADNDTKTSPMVDGRLCVGCGRCARSCPYTTIHLAELC
jgi:NADPH-dependent glutamate synthase beta subunit-like oxidoreductase